MDLFLLKIDYRKSILYHLNVLDSEHEEIDDTVFDY